MAAGACRSLSKSRVSIQRDLARINSPKLTGAAHTIMIVPTLQTIRWTLSVGSRFGRVVPLHTLSIVLLTLVSQLSTLLASFLPLKVVILLGSEHIPRYIPDVFARMGLNPLIIALSAATVGFFLLVLLAERLIDWTTDRATRRILKQSQKMVLFENQDESAANGYQRYSRALAGGVFVLLGLLGFLYVYPAIFGVMLAYSALALGVTLLLYRTSDSFREQLENKPLPKLKLIGGVGFFATFSYLIADFMLLAPPSFIVAIVSLLASRQIFQQATNATADLVALQKQRLKLDALFFHGKALFPEKLREDKTLWPLLQPQRREDWIRPVLAELLGREPGELETSWRQLGIPNVAALKVLEGDNAYLLKLFEHNRSALALHESTLMGESLQSLPGLPWIGATLVGKHHCLVYSLPAGETPPPHQIKELAIPLKTQLLAASPPETLALRFRRSRPMVWQRLQEMSWERLQLTADTSRQQNEINTFLEQLPALLQELKSLPLALFNPDMQPDSFWLPEDGPPLLINWGRWSLEPVGSGWPSQLLSLLEPALAEAAKQRPSLARFSPVKAELAALAFALEQECNRHCFVQALELLPLLLERLSLCESRQPEAKLVP